MSKFERTELLIGKDGLDKLKHSRVAIFGVGGVGGYAFEALVRGGVGELDLIDADVVVESNLNRQIIATTKTLGMPKVEVAKARALEINPEIKINVHQCFYTEKTADSFDFSQYDYVIDAIDTVVGKLSLIERTKAVGVPIICAMGAGNKLDPTRFEVADISKTTVCPLARVIRTELKKRKISKVKVVYSKEVPMKQSLVDEVSKKPVAGSISFVPPVVGLTIAGEVIKDLIKNK